MKILPITMEDTQNKLTVHAMGYVMDTIPEIDPNRRRPAIIICPGGGYHRLSPRESEPVAIQMLALGYQAFLLQYSVDAESFYPKQPIGSFSPLCPSTCDGIHSGSRKNRRRGLFSCRSLNLAAHLSS